MVMQIKLVVVVVVVVSHCKSFLWGGGGNGSVGLWLILLNTGCCTIYEKSCILEIEN